MKPLVRPGAGVLRLRNRISSIPSDVRIFVLGRTRSPARISWIETRSPFRRMTVSEWGVSALICPSIVRIVRFPSANFGMKLCTTPLTKYSPRDRFSDSISSNWYVDGSNQANTVVPSSEESNSTGVPLLNMRDPSDRSDIL